MKQFTRVMKALSEPGRVKILKMLEEKELCVCEITAVLGLAQPTVSKHLRVLEDAGLIASRREGSWVNYRLAAGDDCPYAAAMLAHLATWLNDDKAVVTDLEQLARIDRHNLCPL